MTAWSGLKRAASSRWRGPAAIPSAEVTNLGLRRPSGAGYRIRRRNSRWTTVPAEQRRGPQNMSSACDDSYSARFVADLGKKKYHGG